MSGEMGALAVGGVAAEQVERCGSCSPSRHAFPGGRVVVADDATPGPACLVEFADGMTVLAEWHAAGDAIHPSVPACHTAKGTQVAARDRLLVQQRGGWRSDRMA